MSADVRRSLTDTCARFEYFSIALDQSRDLKDIAQLTTIFLQGVVMPSLDIVKQFSS